MTITHKLTLDLQRKGEMPRIDVVQGDAFTRQVDLVLENGGKPWLFPICEPVARYCKPDGTMGVYDTLPTGAPAFSYAGNMLTLVLAPQMLTCPGVVQVQVEMNDQELKLATFTFLVVVEPGVALYGESEDYVNWTKAFLPQTTGAKVGQYLQISKVDDAGRITEMAPAENPAVEATNKAYEALRIANNVAQEIKAYSPSGTRSIAEEAMRRANSRLVAPQSASVGQYFRVKEVDANGVVTAVEAVDVPVDGGSDTPGADGVTFTPAVAEDGTLSWSNDKGLPNPAPVNIKGPQGKDGSPGKDGSDGVSISHAWNGTTLVVTSASGTSSANLKGDKGDTGAAGADGKTAYQYAQDGGYTGTETEFSTKLSETAVSVTPQTLTDEQKAQARQNIGVTGNKWAGKIASFLGDSITRGKNTDKAYHDYLKELVGFSVCNSYGISGSTISNYYEAMCNRVSSIDAQSDIVFVFGGTNDFNFNVPMGEWYTLDGTTRTVNHDKSTFRGALATLCEALLSRFPNKKNVLLTPLHRHTYPGDYTEMQANSEGLYLEDYVNAIKEAGKIYSIPVLDLYSESGLFPRNAANAAIYFHASDKLHPNATGHRVIADVIMGFLDRTYPMYGEPAPLSYTNLVPSAEERIISGDALTGYDGVGYANNYRLSSSGVIKTAQNAIATGFIPASAGDTIRIGGIQWCLTGGSWNYVCAYKSDYSFVGSVYGSEAGYYGTKIHASCTIDYDAPLTTIGLTSNANIAFIRVSCYNESLQDGSKLIVTVNEEIV